jgi:hypothetical protein
MSKSHHLTGNYFVRATDLALAEVYGMFHRISDVAEIRRHALKLRYWPSPRTEEPSGQVVDLDWSMIRALSGLDIGELRVHDTIGGMNNLRIIFFVGPPSDQFPMTCIWVLYVFQKTRDDFTSTQLNAFKLRRLRVLSHFYAA